MLHSQSTGNLRMRRAPVDAAPPALCVTPLRHIYRAGGAVPRARLWLSFCVARSSELQETELMQAKDRAQQQLIQKVNSRNSYLANVRISCTSINAGN